MRNLTTIILGGACLLLAIIISAVESTQSGGGGGRSRLVRFEEKNVQSLTLMRGGQSVVMQKIQGYWFFISPDQDRINSNSMEALLDQLNHLTVMDQLEPQELVNDMSPANLGMDGEEALQVIITSNTDGKEKTDKFLIGRAAPRANSVYASLAGSKNGVAVVNGNPHDILDSPYDTLLERRMVNVPTSAVVQMAVKTSKTGVVLQRSITEKQTTPWVISKPIRSRADQEKVEDLIASMLSLQIMDVDSADNNPIKIPDPLPDDSALIQFSIFGAKRPTILYLEKDKSQPGSIGPNLLTARISDRPAKYIINSPFLKDLEATAGALRDRRLGKVPEKALETMAIVSGNPVGEVFLESNRNVQGVNWKVLVEKNRVDANYAMIKRLIDQMNEPVIIDFVEGGDRKDYGIDLTKRGSRLIAFNFKIPGLVKPDGSVGPDETFAKVLGLGWQEDGDRRRLFANFQGESSIYELDPKFATLAPTHPVKWRSLNVLSFNPFRLKKITREVVGQAKIVLEYNNSLEQWKAFRPDGSEIPSLDRAMADGLRDRLSSLSATGWNLNFIDRDILSYQPIENPTATFTIVTSEYDPAINKKVDVTRVLKLKDSKGVVYGRVGEAAENPDLFFLDRNKFKRLIQPITGISAM